MGDAKVDIVVNTDMNELGKKMAKAVGGMCYAIGNLTATLTISRESVERLNEGIEKFQKGEKRRRREIARSFGRRSRKSTGRLKKW